MAVHEGVLNRAERQCFFVKCQLKHFDHAVIEAADRDNELHGQCLFFLQRDVLAGLASVFDLAERGRCELSTAIKLVVLRNNTWFRLR